MQHASHTCGGKIWSSLNRYKIQPIIVYTKSRKTKRKKKEGETKRRERNIDSMKRQNSVKISFSPYSRDLRKREVTSISTDLTSHVYAICSVRLCLHTCTHTIPLELSRERTVIRSNNDTSAVIHPRDCARDRHAFYAAHELRAIIFTSVVYLRARIIRRASGWNKIPFGPWSQFPPFSPANSTRIYFLVRTERYEPPRRAWPRRKLRTCQRWSRIDFRRCIRTRYKGYWAARSTLQLRLDPFYRLPVSLVLKNLSKCSLSKNDIRKKMK